MLFRMARGSGISGLAGMRSDFEDAARRKAGTIGLVRPLLGDSEVAADRDAEGRQDPLTPTIRSNRDPRFTRPRLRELMPVLAREGLTRIAAGAACRAACSVSRT